MFDTTGEVRFDRADASDDLDYVGGKGVRDEFNVALVGAAMIFERGALHFQSDTIKVFFEVFVELGCVSVCMLV